MRACPRWRGLPPSTRDRLGRSTFVEAVQWIGAELADGLAHEYERGILHRDVKPANVLLADDGRPMLLDFNLALSPDDVAAIRGLYGARTPDANEGATGNVTIKDSTRIQYRSSFDGSTPLVIYGDVTTPADTHVF